MGAAPLPKSKGGSAPQIGQPPHFIGTWDKTMGYGTNKKRSRKGKGLLLGKKQSIQLNSSNRSNIIKFQKNIPMSNHDLIEWCKYLKIPINEVL